MKRDKLEKWYAGQCSPSFVVYGANDVDATITELKSENERLKAKLESVQVSAYADSVDAGMRERRLRRALYRVLALWANERARLTWSWRKEQGWLKMERKCRAMAEKFK